MILTDTHSHIYSDKYDEDIEHFMDRAFKNNIKRIFVPNINYSNQKSNKKKVVSNK